MVLCLQSKFFFNVITCENAFHIKPWHLDNDLCGKAKTMVRANFIFSFGRKTSHNLYKTRLDRRDQNIHLSKISMVLTIFIKINTVKILCYNIDTFISSMNAIVEKILLSGSRNSIILISSIYFI